METGLIHIYTGDGKGKTTAAIGLAVRCVGSGQKVVFTQLMKGNQSSERNVLEHIEGVYVVPAEKSFGFSWTLSDDGKNEAKKAYTRQFQNAIGKAQAEGCRMIIFDELMSAYNNNMIDRDAVLTFLKSKPAAWEVVLTGRMPEPELVALADYVSEVRKIKHPYDEGIPSRKGIEN